MNEIKIIFIEIIKIKLNKYKSKFSIKETNLIKTHFLNIHFEISNIIRIYNVHIK